MINGGAINAAAINAAFSAYREFLPIRPQWISTDYLCVLTGAADSLPDLTLPISSFQTRMGADPFRVYLSVILPNADAYIDAINARPNGKLKVTRVYNYLDGSFQVFTMAEATIDSISTNQGGQSGVTGTLSGSENMTAVTAQAVTLYDPITRSSDAGRRRYRCRIDPRLRPLDTAIINGESFIVDGVIHIIDPQTAIMEISEQL